MIPFAFIGLLGLALSAGGMGLQAYGTAQANKEAKKQFEIQQQQEQLRRTMMQLEAKRQRREIFRRAAAARATAESVATAQGAEEGSGLPGALSMVSNQGAFATQGVNQAASGGSAMFEMNAQISASRMRQAEGNELAQLGSGLGSLGGKVLSAGPTFNKLIGLI